MDILLCLQALGFVDTGETPAPDLSSYAAMVATWRHPVKDAPTEAAMLAVWPAVEASNAAIAAIATLEAKVTPRRLREAALGDAQAVAFIQDIDNQISAQRALI